MRKNQFHLIMLIFQLLRELQYANSVQTIIFDGVLQNAVQNESFYEFQVQKNVFNGSDTALISEILEVRELMNAVESEDEYYDYYTYLCELYQKLAVDAYSFDYEMSLLSTKKR